MSAHQVMSEKEYQEAINRLLELQMRQGEYMSNPPLVASRVDPNDPWAPWKTEKYSSTYQYFAAGIKAANNAYDLYRGIHGGKFRQFTGGTSGSTKSS